MAASSSKDELTTISVTKGTRDKIRAYKRGQEPYDELLERMAEQYTPPEVEQ